MTLSEFKAVFWLVVTLSWAFGWFVAPRILSWLK